MADIIDIDHEGGDLSEYDSTVDVDGDMSAHADAALASTNFGMKLVIDDTNTMYGQITQVDTGTAKIRIRFYIDPNALTMGNWELFDIFNIYTTNDPWFINRLFLRTDDGGNYFIQCEAYSDAGAISTDTEGISDAPHYVELYIQQAADDASGDGNVEWWIDGVSKGTWANVDNYNIFDEMNIIRVGCISGLDAGTSGTLYIDQIKANDDGAAIGAHAEPPAGNAGIMTPNTGFWGPTF
jgi:hypothetical protein